VKVLLDLDVSGKRVFLRADLDVPLESTKDERLTTNVEIATRLTNLKPAVDYFLKHGASQIIIAGHIGRPKGSDPVLSTKQILPILEKILGQKIVFSSQFTVHSSQSKNSVNHEPTTDNRIVLLENLRFWPGEIANDQNFAQKLANLADIYVNEAFGNSHRAHASMVSLPKLLPHAAGFHLTWEIEELTKILKNPIRPFVAIVGGAKIETKIPVIGNLAKIADTVLVGGQVAKQLTTDKLQLTTEKKSNVIVATLSDGGKDVDKKSIEQFKRVILRVRTIVWNGPMGLFEEGFDKGTLQLAQAICRTNAFKVVGGGETTQFLAQNNLLSKFSFVSSGGGAMLEFLAGKELPAIKALE